MKKIFCILPFWCVPTETILRYDGNWWIKVTQDKLEYAYGRMTSYPTPNQLVAIEKQNINWSRLIIDEFNSSDDPF